MKSDTMPFSDQIKILQLVEMSYSSKHRDPLKCCEHYFSAMYPNSYLEPEYPCKEEHVKYYLLLVEDNFYISFFYKNEQKNINLIMKEIRKKIVLPV
jgi:hypothetical protein